MQWRYLRLLACVAGGPWRPGELREWLGASLVEYMVPSQHRMEVLAALPA